MLITHSSQWLSLWPIALGVAACAASSTTRRALVNGGRCMAVYPILWRLPLLFAFFYLVHQALASAILVRRMGSWRWENVMVEHSLPWFRAFAEASPGALESLASLFFSITTTYPLSAVLGLALMLNWDDAFGELIRGLRRSFPRAWAPLLALLVISLLASMVKPAFFLFLPELANWVTMDLAFPIASAVNGLAAIWEWLLGVAIQVLLILYALAWDRGFQFETHRLRNFAIRRLAFVMRWAFSFTLVAIVLLHVPAFAANFLPSLQEPLLAFSYRWAPPLLAFVLLLFATIEIELCLHNERCREALRAHAGFLKAHWARFLAFLAAAYAICWVVATADSLARNAIHFHGLPLIGAGVVIALVGSITGGWLLASWVCFFRQCENDLRPTPF